MWTVCGKELGVCLIGCGRAGMIHAANYKNRIPGARITAVVDVMEASARAAAQELGIDRCYTDYHELPVPQTAGDLAFGYSVVNPGKVGDEYYFTRGHYHRILETGEVYHCMVVITSGFGTVEMWDWEIITYLRDLGCTVFSPYSVEMGKTILRAIAVKRSLKGANFLMFQDSPGEGMQANIFKKFYWWEAQSTEKMEQTFGIHLVYRSWKEVCQKAREIPDEEARQVSADWHTPMQDVCQEAYLRAVKLYIAVKREALLLGNVAGVGANCLNESFSCDTTPCLAWDMQNYAAGTITKDEACKQLEESFMEYADQ